MRLIKKFFMYLLFLPTFMFIIVPFLEVKAEIADTLIVHYYRYDENYTKWSLWLWPNQPDSGAGLNYTFNGEDGYGVKLTLPLAGTNMENSTRIGFIVRDPDWNKDIAQDRFIDITSPNESGEVHVYLVQNNPNVFYSLENADITHKILNAAFTDSNTISFSLTKPVTEDKVKIYADSVEISTANFNITGSNASIDILEEANLSKRYRIDVDFGDPNPASKTVGFDGFYTSQAFNDAYGYDGQLGPIYSTTSTTFRLWAPISDAITLNLYTFGHTASQQDYSGITGTDTPYSTIPMNRIEKGVWEITVNGNLDGVYYTYSVQNGISTNEVVDPYAYAAGVNGKRGMVVDFSKTNPQGWVYNSRPQTMTHYTDAIIYEIHIRDYTSHATWMGNEEWRGKYLGLSQRGTTFNSVKTGLDHMIELGVTHIQIVPFFDHGIIDETRLKDPTYYGIHDGIFNWGYMPENFNVLEGSYSTDPYNGDVRISEFKTMVKAFHDNDLRLIMDVVYNHTGKSADSNFDLILPGYYFRMNSSGGFSNGSGTGNETASERYMFRKFMVDSLLFYVNEYNIDGFRFDLMKLHDVETMKAIVNALHEIDPTIIIFGEPWTGGTSPLAQANSAWNGTLAQMPGVAVFNDDTRDGIKGSVFQQGDKGFVQGNNATDARVNLGITGGTNQINLSTGALPKGAWAPQPTQTINYVTAHDNNTLYDKLYLSSYETLQNLIRMNRQANAIILTSQGISFLHGGEEILRTKPCVIGGDTCDSANQFDHNSYKSPDETNQINWQWKVTHLETFRYYQTLIALRKNKSVFRLESTEKIAQHLFLIPDTESGFTSFFLHDASDSWKTIYILHNNGNKARTITLQPGNWQVFATTNDIGTINTDAGWTITPLYAQAGDETIIMEPNDTLMMYSSELVQYTAPVITPPVDPAGLSTLGIIGIVTGSVAVIATPIVYLIIRKRKLG